MAKRVIEKFVAEMSADDAKFKRTLARSSKDAADWGRNVRRGLSTGIVVGAGAALVGLTALVKKTSETIDQQAKFADVVGLTTEEFAGYQVAAKITGVEMGQLNTGFTRMLKNVGDAEDGLSTATRALDKLGLSAEDLKQLATDEQIKLIADRFQQLENPVDKASVALNLFGRSGLALGKLLDQGSEGIERFQAEADALGLSVSRVDAAKVELANDALARVNFIAEAAGRSLTIELAPIIEKIADDFVKAGKEAGGMGYAIADAVDAALTPVDWLVDGVHAIKLGFMAMEASALSSKAAIAQTLTLSSRIKTELADLLGFENAFQSDRINIGLADVLSNEAKKGRKLVDEEAMKPLSAAARKAYLTELRKASDDAARESLKTGKGKLSGPAGPTPAEIAAQEAAARREAAALRAIESRGASITQSVLKPNELYKKQLIELDSLLAKNIITEETHNRKQLEYKTALDDSMGVVDLYSEAQRILAEQMDPLDAQLQAMADDQSLLNKAWLEGQISADKFALGMSSIDQKMVDLQEGLEETTNSLSVFADQAARNMQDSFADFLFDPFEDGLSGLADNFAKTLQRMAADAAAASLFESLGVENFLSGGGSGEAGGIASAMDFFGGFFAEGGRPDPYKASIVGEAGPEMFIPDGISGQIVPHHELFGGGGGGEVTVNQTVQVSGTPDNRSAMQMAQETGATLRRAQRLSG